MQLLFYEMFVFSKSKITEFGGSTPKNSSYTATNHPSWKVSKLDKPDMWDTAGDVGTSS